MTLILLTYATLASVASTADAPPVPAPRPIQSKSADADKEGDEAEEHRAPLTEIVVTAKRLDVARARIEPSLGASTYSLTNDAIENRPGGETRDLGSILLQVPGVRRDGNGTLVVRGAPGGAQYRLNNIILPAGVADFGETMSARLADRTELITGALPAQYGLTAGGVIAVTTKNALYFGNGGQVEAYGGSHGTIQPAFEWSAARGGSSLFASGSYRRSDVGIGSIDGSANPLHDRSSELEGFAFADHVIDDRSRVSLIMGSSNERKQIPALAVAGMAGAESRHGDLTTANHYAIGSYQRSGGRATIQASVFGLLSREAVVPDEPLSLAVDGFSRARAAQRRSVGTQIEGAFDLGTAHTLRAGIVASIERERRTDRLASLAATAQSSGVYHRTTTSAFAQDEWRLGERLTANFGLRADRVSDGSGAVNVGPRASVAWIHPTGFSAHAGYARYFIPPTLGERTAAGAAPVRDEIDDYFDVGAEQKFGDFALVLDGYWRSARNLLGERRWDTAPVSDAFNYRRGRLRGVEAAMTYADGPMTAWANIAVARATARGIVSGRSLFTSAQLAAVDSHAIRIDEDQRVTGSGGMSYRFGHMLVSADVTYGSGTPATAVGGPPNGGRLPAHLTGDLAAVYRLKLWDDHPLDVRIDFTNIFDRHYALNDGTSLGGGSLRWGERRGVFVGLEQGF